MIKVKSIIGKKWEIIITCKDIKECEYFLNWYNKEKVIYNLRFREVGV